MALSYSISEELDTYPLLFREALDLLEAGENGQAKELFGKLLREEPENPEFAAGFFCAGWWQNRQADVQFYRPGRPLAAWCMCTWEDFQRQTKERAYQSSASFQKCMRCILSEAAENFRQAFQEEGSGPADTALLKELAICLVQLEDYSNAVDILQYARTKAPYDASLLFLLGESLCSLEKEDQVGRGLSFYRDAFLLNCSVLEARWIASPLASQVFQILAKESGENMEYALLWFPAYLLAASFAYSLRPLRPIEVEKTLQEYQRLQKEQGRSIAKYLERIRSSLCFYLLALLYHYEVSSKGQRPQSGI